MPFTQPLDEYIESFHGRASFSRQRMSRAEAAAFDEAVRELVAPYCGNAVTLHVYAEVAWGTPVEMERGGVGHTGGNGEWRIMNDE